VNILPAHKKHPRQWEKFHFVYPVLSRRAHGISIGINPNPDKRCNFDCIYCQVDRREPSPIQKLDIAVMENELRAMLKLAKSREIFQHEPFTSVPEPLRRVNDIALSGDAEPTTVKNFAEIVEKIVEAKREFSLRDVKIVLLTDAGGLHRENVQRGLALMDKHNGEVWAKLDAGTEKYFKLVNRTAIPFAKILKNITDCARKRAVVIQSLFCKIEGKGPTDAEIGAYCKRLRDIVVAGGLIKLVQIYTVARKPMTMVDGRGAWEFVTALSHKEMDHISELVRRDTRLPVETYYGE
jgi:wyosine [tRNA(Phe)-imidazoG37] synthetase (radical SAM superfamily)